LLVSEILKKTIEKFQNAGVESFALDAEVIIAHVLSVERFRLIVDNDRSLLDEEIEEIDNLVKRRINFEPVAYILGTKEFYSLEFEVNSSVLIPRPETELLVDLAVYYAPQNTRILDLGTGSGVIAVSVKHNRRDLDVYASDISEEALQVARINSEKIVGRDAVSFFAGNLFEPFPDTRFNLIVSNPPYINPEISGTLQKELEYEPQNALYSADNGREITKEIIHKSVDFLTENGILIIETGFDMKEFINECGKSNGYSVSVLNDYSGLPRVGILKKQSQE